MSFKEAVKETQVKTTTDNGMTTFTSSLNTNTDLFFAIGASRGQDISALFERAFQENPIIALKILLWSRDVRGGAGERQIFRDLLQYVEKYHSEYLRPLVEMAPVVGRWDDVLVLQNDGWDIAVSMINEALANGDGLCAKWLPRKGPVAVKLRNALGWTPKRYRKTLVGLSKTVEQYMCAQKWEEIDFNKVPSLASARYQAAFSRNSNAYIEYRKKLESGDDSAKVNAGAVFPHDVIKPLLRFGVDNPAPEVVKAQWEALPNFVGDDLVLPMIDVSGSMYSPVGNNKKLTCMDIAVSLGLYLADKNEGPYKDMFLTFSENPSFNVLSGNIVKKANQITRAEWGFTTDLAKAMDEILRVACDNQVPQEDMPKYLLILSDMQFNQCADMSAYEMIEDRYNKAGYELPKIVFWNIQARIGQIPVEYNQDGVALVSGFSPAIVKNVLAAKSIKPIDIMMDTVDIPRYDVFG